MQTLLDALFSFSLQTNRNDHTKLVKGKTGKETETQRVNMSKKRVRNRWNIGTKERVTESC